MRGKPLAGVCPTRVGVCPGLVAGIKRETVVIGLERNAETHRPIDFIFFCLFSLFPPSLPAAGSLPSCQLAFLSPLPISHKKIPTQHLDWFLFTPNNNTAQRPPHLFFRLPHILIPGPLWTPHPARATTLARQDTTHDRCYRTVHNG